MSQQINLYNPALGPQRSLVSALQDRERAMVRSEKRCSHEDRSPPLGG